MDCSETCVGVGGSLLGVGIFIPVCLNREATKSPDVNESPAPLVLMTVPGGSSAALIFAVQSTQEAGLRDAGEQESVRLQSNRQEKNHSCVGVLTAFWFD